MKTTKILSFLFIVLFSFYTTSCSNDDPTNDPSGGSGGGNTTGLEKGQIEIKVYPDESGRVSFTATAKEISIDWGNGSIDNLTPNGIRREFTHEYPNQNLQTILITSSNIEILSCSSYGTTWKFQEFRIGETSLKEVSLSNLDITTLKIDKSDSLEKLICDRNKLTELDVSKCPALVELRCHDNQLTSLNVSGCTALISLDCSYNQLTSLNVSGFTALMYLNCWSNRLTSLNISGCTALGGILYFAYNQLTAEVLNAIFEALPVVNQVTMFIYGNPGSATCDITIATRKGWNVV